jgi:hypothetical protein
MNDDILSTIEVLSARVRVREEEANKLKKLVNELCTEAGVELRYAISLESGGVSTAIRSDQFYGQTLTAALKNYLDSRKAGGLGAASVDEIYRAVKAGGYKFETASEENAKTGVRNALRLTSSIFHRLPNGQYGLLAWYPSAKAEPESGDSQTKGKSSKKKSAAAENGNIVTNKEIRDVILGRQGEFKVSDIEAEIKAKFPSRDQPGAKISAVLFILKKQKGLIKEASPRTGKNPAVYMKA